MSVKNFLKDGRCSCAPLADRLNAAVREIELPACELHEPVEFERQRVEDAQRGPRAHADRLQRVQDELRIEAGLKTEAAAQREADATHDRLLAELEHNDPLAASLARITGTRFTETADATAISPGDDAALTRIVFAALGTRGQLTTEGDWQ